MKHLLAVAIMAAFSMTAVAWVDGGEDFADRSEKYESKSRKNDYSRGYFQGLVGGVAFATSQPNNGTLAICYPEQSTLSQLITITRKYLENHPEQLHLDSATIIFLALSGAFGRQSEPSCWNHDIWLKHNS